MCIATNFAQDYGLEPETSTVIDSVSLAGNEKTKDYIILRELTFELGDTVTVEDIEFSRIRIIGLGLFYSVKFSLIRNNHNNTLLIQVKESWYIFPLPFLDLQNNDLKKSNYGAYLSWRNFSGRNDHLSGFISLGFDPSYGVSYSNPAITKKSNLILSAGFVHQNSQNKSKKAIELAGQQFDYDIFSGEFGFGKRFGNYNSIKLNTGLIYVESPFATPAITGSGTRIDRNPFINLMYTYDSRDLQQFPQEGYLGYISYALHGWGISDYNYSIIGLDYRQYQKLIFNINSKWRLATRNTFGKNIPFYHYSYLGFDEYIRGNKNKEREGNNSFIGSLEISYPIFEEWEFSLDLPLLPESLTSLLISVYISTYADAGITYNNQEKINFNKFDSGYGFGLTILFLPYNAVRFEYAFNEYGRGEFLFGTGFSF